MKYIKGLDVLRAFAVFFVIITHWGPHQVKSPFLTIIFQNIIPHGDFGVDLFFVLSGYLISKILLSLKESDASRTAIIKTFYIRRALRIFPLYYLIVILAYIFNDASVRDNLIYYVTYTSNILAFKPNGLGLLLHTWSLAVEEQFYLIWPFVIIFVPSKYLLKTILGFLMVGILSSLILHFIFGPPFKMALPSPFIAFAIGSLLALADIDQKVSKVTKQILLILLPISIILLLVHQFGYTFILNRLLNSIIAANLIIYVANERYNKFTALIFTNKFLIHLGKISYGIYLYHYLVPTYWDRVVDYSNTYFSFTDKTLRLLKYPPSAYILELFLTYIICYLSYNFFELKFIKLKDSFNYILEKQNRNLQNV